MINGFKTGQSSKNAKRDLMRPDESVSRHRTLGTMLNNRIILFYSEHMVPYIILLYNKHYYKIVV